MLRILSIFLCFLTLVSTVYPSHKKIKISALTLEEKVGQMLMAHFEGLHLNEEAKTLINTCHIGGIIYYSFANPFKSPEEVQRLSFSLQNQAKKSSGIPLFICVDQEGGFVNRLEEGFTIFPSPKAIANAGSLPLAKACAQALAQELKACGVNMNLSPVIDVNSPENPVIGTRSFSDNSSTVIDYAKAFLKGFKHDSLISCLKHFPGHGFVKADSHEALPICLKNLKELEACDLKPFRSLHLKTDCIMTAHVLYPKLDSNFCATLSQPILEVLLRQKIGFKGVIISDSLIMDGLLNNSTSIEDAAIQAIKAGCDILILGGKQLIGERKGFELKPSDVTRIHKKICEAVRQGVISESRINNSVERILKLKKAYHLFAEKTPQKEDLKHLVGIQSHAQLTQHVADLSLKIETEKTSFENFNNSIVIAPTFVSNTILRSDFAQHGSSFIFYDNLNPSEEEMSLIKNQLSQHKGIIFLTFKSWRFPNQIALLKQLNQKASTLVISLSEETNISAFKGLSHTFISTENPTPSALNAVYKKIRKNKEALK